MHPGKVAAEQRGLYCTPVSSRLRPGEVAYTIGGSGAGVFITSKAMADGRVSVAAVPSRVHLRLMLDAVAAGFI
jgi:hypothetical protein